MKKKTVTILAFTLVLVAGVMSIQGANASSLFTIVLGSQQVDGSGWLAGYVVYGQSGTYTLQIAANGAQDSFPISNVKIIVLVSEDAAAGGLQALSIEGTPISTFTMGQPSYYGANGGPFAEPDYYGYNDQYVIPSLTYSEGALARQLQSGHGNREF